MLERGLPGGIKPRALIIFHGITKKHLPSASWQTRVGANKKGKVLYSTTALCVLNYSIGRVLLLINYLSEARVRGGTNPPEIPKGVGQRYPSTDQLQPSGFQNSSQIQKRLRDEIEQIQWQSMSCFESSHGTYQVSGKLTAKTDHKTSNYERKYFSQQ